MITKVIDRKTNKITEERSPKGANFLYKNFFGRVVLKVANKRFISNIVGRHLNKKKSTKYIENFIKDKVFLSMVLHTPNIKCKTNT